MAALGAFIILFIFLLLGLASVVFLILILTAKKSFKPWTLLGSIFFCAFLLFSYKSCLNEAHRKSQLNQVGIYYLTKYHNCDSCILELKEDLTYQVRSKDKIVEESNWHYESGRDYWITWLDNHRHQLGSGDYSYEHYKLKYSGQSN